MRCDAATLQSSKWSLNVTIFVVVVFLWIFSVCLHEFAHAWVAYRGGDFTVKEKGYLTLNPVNYIDPLNSLILPVAIMILGGIGLPGAAVYIRDDLLRSKHWKAAVSLAGPAMNLVILIVTGVILSMFAQPGSALSHTLSVFAFLQATSIIFNLLPIPGFDGFGALAPFMSHESQARAYQYANHIMIGFILAFMFIPQVRAIVFVPASLLLMVVGIDFQDVLAGWTAFRFWK
jgi:Zn-dependent protease